MKNLDDSEKREDFAEVMKTKPRTATAPIVAAVPFEFPGDALSYGRVYRYSINSGAVMGFTKNLGLPAAVVLVESAMVVIEVKIRESVASYLNELSLADPRFRHAFGGRVAGTLPFVLNGDDWRWIENFGSLQGFRTSKFLLALEMHQAQRIFELADGIPGKFRLFIRAAIARTAGEILEFRARKGATA